jgi:predicted nucleic acid-binding Zn ribbon protein
MTRPPRARGASSPEARGASAKDAGGASSMGVPRARVGARAPARPRGPRPLAQALGELTDSLAPRTLLGRVQTVWERATGPTIAAAARPTAEREGVLTVICESSVWAQELEMLSAELLASLNTALGEDAISRLRCRAG